jgi:chromosome segregation ATPase
MISHFCFVFCFFWFLLCAGGVRCGVVVVVVVQMAAVTESYEQEVDVLKERCAVIERDCERLQRQLTEVRTQMEDDADAEIESFKAKNEERLFEQKQITLGLKGENTHMKKKFAALEKNIIDQNDNLRAFQDKEVELADKKKELDDLIESHKADIDERDNRIGKHETDIYDLKKENQELEKYKFVLDYQIKHYKTQIEPKDKAIQKMKEK